MAPRVLVVDDDAAQRVLLRRILATAGITEVEFAGDRHGLITAVEQFDPDLVTLDLHLGGDDAFGALESLMTSDPDWAKRRVMLITGDTNPSISEQARSFGIHRVLHKPFTIDALLASVMDVLERPGCAPGAIDVAREDATAADPVEGPTPTGLTDVVCALADTRTVEEIADLVRSAARRLTGADGATFVVRDGDWCHYLDEDAIAPLWKGQRFPMSACISGWSMLNRQIAVIHDIFADPRIPHDVYRPTFVKSLVMMPVRTKDPIAAIGTYWSVPRTPTTDELRLLQALADSTALALQNIRLYRQLDATHGRTADLTSTNDQLRDFVYAVAHDIRGPLSTIHGLAELLARDTEDLTDDTVEAIDLIRASALGLSTFVTDLLEFAIADGRLPDKPIVSLGELVDDATGRLAEQISARHAHVMVADDEIIGDRAMLAQILQNLISNALAYVPTDRTPDVRIAVRRTRVGQDLIVSDNGDGIPPDEREIIFQPFRRGSNSSHRAGTGLGLALCRRAARRHGGDVIVRDARGGGAEFVVSLSDATN